MQTFWLLLRGRGTPLRISEIDEGTEEQTDDEVNPEVRDRQREV
jgi:hypothetical protein